MRKKCSIQVRLDPVLCTSSPVDGQQVDVNTGDDCPDLKDHCSYDDYADNGDPGGACTYNTTTGIPDENCYFVPNPDADVSRSSNITYSSYDIKISSQLQLLYGGALPRRCD